MIKGILDRFIGKAGDGGHYQLAASLILSSLLMGFVLLLLADDNNLSEGFLLLQDIIPWAIPVQFTIGLYLWFSPADK